MKRNIQRTEQREKGKMENTKLLVTVLSFVMLAAFLMPSMRNVGVTQETTLPPVATPVHNISTGLNYTTIQAAIDAPETMDGHMLMCDAGNYTENVNVYKSLKIVGAGPTITWLVPSEPNDTIGISVSDVTIEGFTVQSVSGYSGVLLNEVSGCNISNNVLTGEGWGIFLRGSNDNVISGNTMYSLSANGVTLSDSSLRNQVISNIMNQNHYGICVYNASNYNVISGNMVNSSDWDGIRLNWQGSNCAPVAFNNVTNNVATHSGDAGIFVDTPSPYNLLEDNFLSDDYIGMRLRQTNSSTLVRNTIVSNSYRGISAESSYGNIVYDNFLNNTNNAWDNGANLWNTTRTQATNVLGRPFTGGNYWSDASNLPDKDNDGIGETGYSVPGGNNVDMLPLVQSYIDVVPLEYDPTTQTGTIRWKVDPTAFYRSELEANGTVFDQIDLPSRNYYGQAACGIPSDLLLGYTADVGGPEIPVVKLCIGIPPEMEPESYPIGDVECVGTIENTLVLPVPTYEAPESSPTYVMNTTVYSSSVPYPSGWSAQPNVGSLYGLKTVTIELHPVQYIPANGTVYVYKMEGSIDLKGQFEGGVPQQADEKALNEEIPNLYEAKYWPAQIFSASAKMLVPARPPSPVNLEAIAVLNSIHLCPTSQPEPPYSILIISADNFATQAAALAYEKSTRSSNPIPTAWIKVSEILSVLQDFASVGSDIPSMIREFIRVLYDYFSPRPEYVILLGDAPMLGITFANSLPTIKDAEGNYHSGIYDCYKYPLGSDIHHQAYAQSFTAGADGVVSITLLLNRTFDIPNYGITVSIQAGEVDNGPNGHVLTSFDIDQSDLKAEVSKDSIGGWALTHNFAYVTSTGTAQLDPSKTYFLVINADNVNAAAYYYIYT
jgi:parallel beta-helix repeat protein